MATTGALAEDGMAQALEALRRFRKLCEFMQIEDVRPVATAAARDASNGAQFLAAAEKAIGRPIELISGVREAHSRLWAWFRPCTMPMAWSAISAAVRWN